jgi:sugar phosphate isomerase/epimerase
MTDRRAAFELSGFGDEIADEADEQLGVLGRLGIRFLDLRGAWGRNVLDLTPEDLSRLQDALRAHGARVSTIASPIGKSEIDRDASYELDRLEVALRLAEAFETTLIRVFSFYHEGIEHADFRDEVLRRMDAFAGRAEQAGVTLLLENERGLWGDIPERCLEVLSLVDSPSLRMTLDTGNFAQMGVRSADEAYPLLREYVTHIQIKDVRSADGAITVAGEGDGQVPELLAALRRDGYRGFLSLEPHLALAEKARGFSGPELFGQAAAALQRIVADVEKGD